MATFQFLPAPRRGPNFGDRITIGDETFAVEAIPLCQPSAPTVYEIEAPRGTVRQVRWNGQGWIADAAPAVPDPLDRDRERMQAILDRQHARAEKILKRKAVAVIQEPTVTGVAVTEAREPQAAPVRRARRDTVRSNSMASTKSAGLHEQLDEARDKYNKAVEADDAARIEATWPDYEKSILAVNEADPGFYLGRRSPIAPLPFSTIPDLDYAGISARTNLTGRSSPKTPAQSLRTIPARWRLSPKGVCRVCGCTDFDCTQCIRKTGSPCSWVEPDLCSACAPDAKVQN